MVVVVLTVVPVPASVAALAVDLAALLVAAQSN
jgi:hypothetical protein